MPSNIFQIGLKKKDYNLLDSVARTSLSFYGIIGLVNSFILIVIACFGLSMFSLESAQVPVMRNMFFYNSFFFYYKLGVAQYLINF